MAAAEEIELAPPAAKSSKLSTVLIGLLAGLVLAGGAGAALYFTGMLAFSDAPTGAPGEESELKQELPKKAVYISLDPAFTVNFQGQGRARFLQLSVELMAREPGVEELVKRHMPLIRNHLVLLFSGQSASDLGTREGKERLQADTLAAIRGVLEKESGIPGIEAVYFTSFIMQ